MITSEFDDCVDPAATRQGRQPSRSRSPLPELIADAYRRAAAPVRRMLLERLLRPVGRQTGSDGGLLTLSTGRAPRSGRAMRSGTES